MNKVILNGIIKNITPSHSINNIDYDKANLIVKRESGKEDIVNLKFKRYSNRYVEDQQVQLIGNLRTYSKRLENKNSVELFVFTYFDLPDDEDMDKTNRVEIDGRICSIDNVHTTKDNRQYVHITLANNLMKENKKLNSYIPCVAWGNTAKEIAALPVNTKLNIIGELHSREYTKTLDNGDVEIRIAQEMLIQSFEVIE